MNSNKLKEFCKSVGINKVGIAKIGPYEDLKRINMNKVEYTKFFNGVKLEYNEQDKLVKVYESNKYKGLGQIKDGVLKRYLIENE